MEKQNRVIHNPTSFRFSPETKDIFEQICKHHRRTGLTTLTILIEEEAKKLNIKPSVPKPPPKS